MKIKLNLSKLILSAALALVAVLPIDINAQSSVGSGGSGKMYQPAPIKLPFTFLLAGSISNLATGWSVVTTWTNTTITWSPASSAFTTNTTITTNTATTYANFDSSGQRYVALEFDNHGSGSSTERLFCQVAKSVGGTFFDVSTNMISYTNLVSGTTTNAFTLLVDMAGFGYGRVTSIGWLGATVTLTNDGFNASVKRGD